MPIRKIRTMGDRILNKVCRPVEEMTPKIQELIEDMLETMYDAYGVGLAAPQVGMLKRIVVIDIGDENGPYVLINPVIKETSGEQTGEEGCLSVPGKSGVVTRPNVVTVEALDINMEPFILTGEGLLARAICHECEHLDGILYVEHVEGEQHDVNDEEEDGEGMRVVFMGTPDFSVGTLRELAKAGHEIAGVVSQPDKPKGRGKNLQPTPVKEAAMELGLPVYQPQKVRDPEFIQVMKELNPDVIVVVAFGQIIPKEILHMPKYGCINVHASLLPAYRGAAPIQWAVINGDKESGVTIMRMDEGVDTGDMINKVIVPLNEKETGGSLFDRLSESGAKLLVETLPMLEDGSAVFEKQPEESTTPYAAMISKKMGELDWAKSATELERLIRGLNPWPSAFSHLNGKTLKIWEASVEEENGEKKAPGTVLQADAKGFRIQTGEGILKIDTLQMEGKKRMDAQAFLRGYTVEEGMILPC